MNIFWLSMDPKQCAQMHCDKHVVKMPLEMVQMLCTTHWQHGNEAPYMPVAPPALKARGVTTLPQAMPEQYKHHDVMVAYRDYYRGEKSKFCKWTDRPIPDFMLDLCA